MASPANRPRPLLLSASRGLSLVPLFPVVTLPKLGQRGRDGEGDAGEQEGAGTLSPPCLESSSGQAWSLLPQVEAALLQDLAPNSSKGQRGWPGVSGLFPTACRLVQRGGGSPSHWSKGRCGHGPPEPLSGEGGSQAWRREWVRDWGQGLSPRWSCSWQVRGWRGPRVARPGGDLGGGQEELTTS